MAEVSIERVIWHKYNVGALRLRIEVLGFFCYFLGLNC